MAKRCDLTGKGVMTGNNVSHAKNRTKRRFEPNLQASTLHSEVLGAVRLKVAAATLRSVERRGGLDAFLLSSPDSRLTEKAVRLKRRLRRASEKAAAKAA